VGTTRLGPADALAASASARDTFRAGHGASFQASTIGTVADRDKGSAVARRRGKASEWCGRTGFPQEGRLGTSIVVGLNAVIVAVTDEEPRLLTVERPAEARGGRPPEPALPFGPLDPAGHRTLELGLRPGSGTDRARAGLRRTALHLRRPQPRPAREGGGPRMVSIAYLALVREDGCPVPGARAAGFYEFLPWRTGAPGDRRWSRR